MNIVKTIEVTESTGVNRFIKIVEEWSDTDGHREFVRELPEKEACRVLFCLNTVGLSPHQEAWNKKMETLAAKEAASVMWV